MKKKIYVETTIPSFYFEPREEPEMLARREWTRIWWRQALGRDDLVTSPVVIDELEGGDHPGRDECLRLVERLPVLSVEPEVQEIVETYISRRVMPKDPVGDALHLAVASYHRCDFLVTWNCRHLANANKFSHIRMVNTMLGLYVPAMVTPLELVAEEEDDEQ